MAGRLCQPGHLPGPEQQSGDSADGPGSEKHPTWHGAFGCAALAAPKAEVMLLSTYVAGTAYHDAADAASTLCPGEPVTLQRESKTITIGARSRCEPAPA